MWPGLLPQGRSWRPMLTQVAATQVAVIAVAFLVCAARPDLLPKPYLDALSELQDRLPSFPSSIAYTGESQPRLMLPGETTHAACPLSRSPAFGGACWQLLCKAHTDLLLEQVPRPEKGWCLLSRPIHVRSPRLHSHCPSGRVPPTQTAVHWVGAPPLCATLGLRVAPRTSRLPRLRHGCSWGGAR